MRDNRQWARYIKLTDLNEEDYKAHVEQLRRKKEIRDLEAIAKRTQLNSKPKVILRRLNEVRS